MSQDTRPAKRTRALSSLETPGKDSFKHDDEFWFEDGNVILVARDTGFRIYRGLLAAQSSVFADMFAASSPDVAESHAGCPIVQLSDSPEDLRDFLRVLLPKCRRTYYQEIHDYPFEEVLAVIRMAHKYHVDDILQQGLDCVRASYPATFSKYTSLPTEPQPNPKHAIAVVNIARLTDTQSLLPLALYRCCCLGGDLLDGWERRDGSVEVLSTQDLKLCFSGRDAIAKEAYPFVERVFRVEPTVDCPEGIFDESSLLNIRERALEEERVGASDILSSWDDFIRLNISEEDLCEQCGLNLVSQHAQERLALWRKLPGWFGLTVDGWDA